MKGSLPPCALQWAGALFLFITCVWLWWPLDTLQVTDAETAEVYFRLPAREGETIRLSWIHSVERTPWVEEYEMVDGRFSLREVRVQSFGAGVDVEASEVINREGWVVMRGIDRSDPVLSFWYSPRVRYQLEVDGHSLELEQRVEHNRPLEIRMETWSRLWIMIDGGGGF
ncbi:DUF1850 domain-containing protein [Desmospora profundinema]|uniref:DUF1850 domain-containing protein n=1 Tax=Desmospora profundinema TaxID=1571184 RepID=A0ABU1IHY2_9BACL|nr:DUF1850 domain-containing protein [Desmospora profundinema]MDR6224381.1 hypothetical protein [Desmospora profundinema]